MFVKANLLVLAGWKRILLWFLNVKLRTAARLLS